MSTTGERLLTLPEHSRRLGGDLDQRGHKLRRLLCAAERRAGRRIGVRHAGASRTQWKVTERQLRRYLPELFETKAAATEFKAEVRRHLRDVDRRAESVARDTAREECGAVRQELGELIVEVAKGVGQLERRVAGLEGGAASGVSPG